MSLNFNYSSTSPSLLQNAKNLASNVVNQFIVRPLGQPNLIGVSGFIFDILDDEEITIESEITDHYVESNYAIQDHIALKPIRFTLRGYSGELVDNVPNALATIFNQVNSLVTLGGLAPQFNIQDSQFYSKVNDVAQKTINVFNEATSLSQLFSNSSTTTNKQQKTLQYFKSIWETRQLVQVETPFMIFDSMAIESIRAIQTGATRFISDFTVTFKQILTVNSITLTNSIGSLLSQNLGSISNQLPVPGGVFQQMVSSVSNQGTDQGTSIDSLGSQISVSNKLQSLLLQQSLPPAQY